MPPAIAGLVPPEIFEPQHFRYHCDVSQKPLPRRVLIANRGEIAVRIARTCRALGVEVVAVHVAAEREAAHVLVAQASCEVPGHLDGAALIEAAHSTGADAVHPGYGFLSENAAFARAVEAADLTWIGPPPEAIDVMGSKTAARTAMEAAGVPVVPGTAAASPERLIGPAAGLGYPVLVKPAGGGGGKGMVRVDRPADLAAAAKAASELALQAFGDPAVYVEKLIERPRHIEIQVFGDQHGNVVALGERECSIQRRHQKILEEAPSMAIDEPLRARMSKAAEEAARAVKYVGAGTVEFLLASDGAFYFLEMNTRLQVEHPVTEMIFGLDLVQLQLEVAIGRPLPASVLSPERRGHAIEARVYAEDPAMGHLPQAGRILVLREPVAPGLRIDSALREDTAVGIDFDPLLAKIIAWGADREQARVRLLEGLSRFVILGVRTNIDYLQDILRAPAFISADLSTAFLDEHLAGWPGDVAVSLPAQAASALAGSSAAAALGIGRAARPDPWATLTALRLGLRSGGRA